MAKLTKKHFDLFRKECEYWIDKFNLDNWNIVFLTEELEEGRLAEVRTKLNSYTANIIINSTWDKDILNNMDEEIKNAAKHEVIHILLSRLTESGSGKSYTYTDMYEAEEELVNKLEKLIK